MYDTDRIYVLMFHTKSKPLSRFRFDCITHRGYEAAVEKLRKEIGEEPVIDSWHTEDIV